MSSIPPLGTGFSDGTRAGPQVLAGTFTGTPGAPISPLFVYDIAPQPASAINIAPLQIVGAGTTLAVGSGLVNSGNSGTNVVELFPTNLQNIVMFDCDRAVVIVTVAGGSGSTFTFYGIDILGNFVTKILDTPAGAAVTISSWTMAGVFRVFVSAATTTAISIGCADAFGLPYVAYNSNYLIPYFNGVVDNVTPAVLVGISGAMTAGAITIADPDVTKNSLIFTSRNTGGGTAGYLAASTLHPGVSFDIVSSNALDTSTVNYEIVTPSYTAGSANLVGVAGPGSAVTVYNQNILPTDVIRLGVNTFGNTPSPGTLSYVLGVDANLGPYFTVTSSNAADRSVINWQILRTSGEYAGGVILTTGGVSTLPSPVVINGQTLVFSNYITNVNPGFLSQGAITTGVQYIIDSTSGTDTSAVAVLLKNPTALGQYILPDKTNPATITSGDPRGVYIPSSPSDGISRLTIWMYNRGVLNANATIGASLSDPLFANTNVNLYGVPQYTDNNH